MAMNKIARKKPVVFGRKKAEKIKNANNDDNDSDDTLDMLLHYAQAGMEYAEKSLAESPNLFSAEEMSQFQQNKNMLDQAPFLIKSYKSKVNEHNALHAKMMGILKKCQDIVSSGDKQAKEEIKEVIENASVFSYDKDGNFTVQKNTS